MQQFSPTNVTDLLKQIFLAPVAQRRRRVFVIASTRDDFDPTEVLFEFEGVRRDSPPSRESGQGVTGTISSRTSGGGGFGTDFECAEGLQPVAFGGNNTRGSIDVATARNACGSASGRMDFETETFLIQHVSGMLLSNGKAAGSATQQDAECGMLVPAYSAAALSHSAAKTTVATPVSIFRQPCDPVTTTRVMPRAASRRRFVLLAT